MKRCLVILFLLLCSFEILIAQGAGDISFKQVPVDLRIQIGFLFVYILLGLLFLMMFVFYPRQRLNLHFSLYNISLALMVINQLIFKPGAYGSIANDTEQFISRMVGANILLFILYAIDRIRPYYWWLIGYILFIDFPLVIILRDQYAVFNEIVHSIFTIVCFFAAIAAFKNKSPGSWLIGLVALAVVFINIGSVLYFFGKLQAVPAPVLGIVPFVITVCVVTYLALRYARTNTSLEQQLVQVQQLSEENLRKEQERQQLLAEQNEMLEKQVAERTSALRQSLDDLRLTQTQLIQAEKMASLGELTAGIAHEIQNPLNFVNNFSEVNDELLKELKAEAEKGNLDEVKAIAKDIEFNSEKINHHGRRADAIVKGMLQHSRTSSGQKEPTDINALADEYLRLAYHGLRAKDKSFNATMKTGFDESIGKINIIPQDIGRVILNLINNAFYAVDERKKSPHPLKGGMECEPIVTVTTKRLGPPSGDRGKIEIRVADNGNGIPQKVLDKIFQPFFTTKPTGQGTGLGLSLSYDIVKAHGGELKVETKEGEGTVFVIYLPT